MKKLILLLLLIGCSSNKDNKSPKCLKLAAGNVIIGKVDWVEASSLSPGVIRDNANAVVDVHIPEALSRCTGFFINENMIMTNNHCVYKKSIAKDLYIYTNKEKGQTDLIRYTCDKFITTHSGLDFSILECEGSPGKEHGYVRLSDEDSTEGEDIYLIHQNCDYRKKGCPHDKKVSFGEIKNNNYDIKHNADTLGGSSGSPVFDKTTNKVVGLHHAGSNENQINYAVKMHRIVSWLKENEPDIEFFTKTPDVPPVDPCLN